MNHAKKYVLIPENREKSVFENESNKDNQNMDNQDISNVPSTLNIKNQREKVKRQKNPDRVVSLLKIALHLNKSRNFNNSGNLLDESGGVIPKTNIYQLIKTAATPGRLLTGQHEFIRILHNNGVPPELILNETIRNMLINFKETVDKGLSAKPNTSLSTLDNEPKSGKKRKRISLRENKDQDSDYDNHIVKIPRWDKNGNK